MIEQSQQEVDGVAKATHHLQYPFEKKENARFVDTYLDVLRGRSDL